MLHLILSEKTVYESDQKAAVAVLLFGHQSSLDHISQRTGTGYCFYRTVEGFPSDGREEVRSNDAIAISDEFTDDEIANVIDEYAHQVPVLIISADKAVSKRECLSSKLSHPNVAVVNTNIYKL